MGGWVSELACEAAGGRADAVKREVVWRRTHASDPRVPGVAWQRAREKRGGAHDSPARLTADGRVHEEGRPEAGALGRLAAVLLAEREHHQVVGVQRLEVAHCVVRGENVAKRGEGKRGMVSDGGGRFRSAAAGHGRARASERARSGPAMGWAYSCARRHGRKVRGRAGGGRGAHKTSRYVRGGVSTKTDIVSQVQHGVVGGGDSHILPMFSEAERRCSAPLLAL